MSEQQADDLIARIAHEIVDSGATFAQGWALRKRDVFATGRWAVMVRVDHLLLTFVSSDEWNDKSRGWAGLPLKQEAT